MAKRASLANSPLAARLQPKASPAAEGAPESETAVAASPAAQRDFKTAMMRINRVGWQELSFLSTTLDRPLEELLVEAANDLLVKYGKSPVIEKRQPGKV